jgi:Family of unknown function (DUF6493)
VSVADRDPSQVRDELVALKEPERRKRAKAAQQAFDKLRWPAAGERPSSEWQAAALQWVGTATARQVTTGFWRIGFCLDAEPRLGDDVYGVLAARGRSFFETFARGVLGNEGGWGSWPVVRRAVRDGLIEPPERDDYLRRMVVNVGSQRGMDELDATYDELLADPSLLEREVWQLFEVDLGSELSNATTWEQAPGAEGPGSRGDNRWIYALTRLAAEGRLKRSRLLDASLDALLRDFRASSVGWYAKLHEALEPTPEERVERLDRYLSLVTSPASAVVKEGLAALRTIEDAVPPEAFARVAPTPFSQRQKNLSIETLALLDRLSQGHAEERPVLLGAAAQALGHERTDVQERALKLLERHPDDAPRAALLRYVEVVSPTLRARVEALTGVTTPRDDDGPVAVEPPTAVHRPADVVVEASAPLEPVATVDELIELAAMLVEGGGDGDDCERFLDGVSRLCAERPVGFERRTAGLAKRAETAAYWGPVASGAELVAYVVSAWTRGERAGRLGGSQTVFGLLVGRAEEVARRAARRRARPLLAFPTHSGGFIDREVLDDRLSRTGRLLNRPEPNDRDQAYARALAPREPLVYERQVIETTKWGRTTRRLRLRSPEAPAELGELRTLAERAGAADEKETTWYGGPVAWAGFDRLGTRWALTVLPSLPEVAFAGSATVAVTAREASDTTSGHPEAVIELALERAIPLPPIAWLTVAACLLVRSPGVTRVAVDLLVASVDDGRFDADALGREIAWLVDNDFAKMNRLEAPFRDLARVSPLHATQAMRTIERVLAHLGTRPHGLHALLDVAVEAAAATGRRIEDEQARATLTAIAGAVSRSSKLGRLARSLIEA